jgi:hypothetical protein
VGPVFLYVTPKVLPRIDADGKTVFSHQTPWQGYKNLFDKTLAFLDKKGLESYVWQTLLS